MTDLVTTISAEEFASNREFVKGVLVARDPSLDLSTGSAIDGLLVENEAHLAALHAARYSQLGQSFSLKAIADHLVTVDDAQVDSLISNYGITRQGATNATGPVKIVVDQPTPMQIPAGFKLTLDGLAYVTSQSFRVYGPDSVGVIDGTSTRRMVQRADGKFEFTITVAAVTAGIASQLAAGTVLSIDVPIAGMVSATVAADFSGAQERESNQALLARAMQGVTAAVLAGPEHIQATIAKQFTGTTVAVVGVGSPLMTRDRANLFGWSQGGKQDLYCRTSAYPRKKTLRLTGTVIDGATKSVLLPVPYADGVGVYRITAIRPANLNALGGMKPTSLNLAIYRNTPWIPKLQTPTQAAFSANVAINAQFIDSLGVGVFATNDKRDYDVDFLYMPNIEAINSFVTGSAVRPASQDLLVRAGVPCSVVVSATLRIPSTSPSPDLAALKVAISNAINALPYGTQSLSAYVVHRAVAAVVTSGDLVNTVLRGTVYAPDGTDISIATGPELALPDNPAAGVGPANTFFSASPDQVELILVSR